METILHPKIKQLKTRSSAAINHGAVRFDDETIHQRVTEHILELRKARKIEENQALICFCVWGEKDDRGTGWVRGAFTKSIKERGPKSKANQKIAFVLQHRLEDPIGRPLDIFEDEVGAFALVEFDDPESVPSAKRAKAQIKSGTLNGYSFGFNYIWDKDKIYYDEKADTVWIKEAALYEISPVTFSSMKGTHTVRSSKADYEVRKMHLDEQTNDFIKSLPASKQLELRQIIHDHTTLAKMEPEEETPLNQDKPGMKFGDLVIDVNKL